MRKITEWYRFDDKTRKYEFNHIEDGHIPYTQSNPIPISEFQKQSWKNVLWIRKHLNLEK